MLKVQVISYINNIMIWNDGSFGELILIIITILTAKLKNINVFWPYFFQCYQWGLKRDSYSCLKFNWFHIIMILALTILDDLSNLTFIYLTYMSKGKLKYKKVFWPTVFSILYMFAWNFESSPPIYNGS